MKKTKIIKKKLIVKNLVVLLLFSLMFQSFFSCGFAKSKQKYTNSYFGYFDTVSTVVGYFDNESEFLKVSELVNMRLEEYHSLYDIYNSYPDIINLNDVNNLYGGVHKKFTVDEKIIDMLLYAKELYLLTGGEMNVAMGSVVSMWHECREAARKNNFASLPDSKELAEAALHTDINSLVIDEEACSVYITDPKMTLDVGAVAKGYATEMIAKELESMGVGGVALNIGGNIRVIGSKPGNEPWFVGIENPFPDLPDAYCEYVEIYNGAIVTSGSYQRFFSIDERKYHHIIDKDTLYPSENFVLVSVWSRSSALSDSLSTALFSMDKKSGKALVEGLDGVEAMWVSSGGEKFYSTGWNLLLKE